MSGRYLDASTRALFHRVLTIVLAIALLVAIGGVVYVASTPGGQEDPFTEFYILGPGGEAADYPTNLTVGDEREFIVGITNNEHQDLTYTVVLTMDSEVIQERTVEVGDGETWEDQFVFTVTEPGEKRLLIQLFVGDEVESDEEPYRDLRLIVDVRE